VRAVNRFYDTHRSPMEFQDLHTATLTRRDGVPLAQAAGRDGDSAPHRPSKRVGGSMRPEAAPFVPAVLDPICGLEFHSSGSAAHLVAPDPATAPSRGALVSAFAPLHVDRVTVSPLLTLPTASLRAAPDPQLIGTTRWRRMRMDLLLVVRRAERGSASGSPALPGRCPTVSRGRRRGWRRTPPPRRGGPSGVWPASRARYRSCAGS
jgi:hypothetical protein